MLWSKRARPIMGMSESRGMATDSKPLTRGEVPPEPKITTMRKPVPPRASRLMAVPEMIWSASKVTHIRAWIRAKRSPAPSAVKRADERAPTQDRTDDPGEGGDQHELLQPDIN